MPRHTTRFPLFAALFSIALAVLLAAGALPVQAAIRTVTGTVSRVSDGDTLQVLTPDQTKLTVRLYGLDAPETVKADYRTGRIKKPGQPYGDEAWKYLENMVLGKQVTVEILNIDRYRRMVCVIWLDGRNINLEMVAAGYAEAYPEYLRPPYRQAFLDAEKSAKTSRLDIWAQQDYERPSLFRKRIGSGE